MTYFSRNKRMVAKTPRQGGRSDGAAEHHAHFPRNGQRPGRIYGENGTSSR